MAGDRDNVAGVSWQTGADVVVRANGAAGALPNTNDTNQPRAIKDSWPVLGLNRTLGDVGPGGSAQTVFSIGQVRTPAGSYLGSNLDPWYLGHQHTYGIQLDPRNQYSKIDWELWTAAFLSGHAEARNAFISKTYLFLNSSASRVPLTDLYDTNTGNQQGFQDRPVVGGLLALLNLRSAPHGLTE